MGSSTGAPFSLAIPDDDDLATFVLDYLNPNLIALNSNAVHRTGAVVLSGGKRYTSSGLTLTSDTPILDAAVTFNAPGVVLNAAVVNVTDTASHANSTLLDLKVAGTSKFAVRKDGQVVAAGNVSVGVTPSAWNAGNRVIQVGQTGVILANAVGPTVNLQENSYNDGTNNRALITGAASVFGQTGGAHIWYNAPSVSAGAVQTFTERMRLDADGNLGLTNTPPALHPARRALFVGDAVMLMGGTSYNGTELRVNSYQNASNVAIALTTNAGGSLALVNDTLSYSNAPSVAAGAAQTFTARFSIAATGALSFNTTVSGTANAGGVTPPATVQGYIAATVNGVPVKVPYYAN